MPSDNCAELFLISAMVDEEETLVGPAPAEIFYSLLFIDSVAFPVLHPPGRLQLTFLGTPGAIFDVWFGDKTAVKAKFLALAFG